MSFELPRTTPKSEVLSRSSDWVTEPLSLDLVHVDLDARKVYLSWRISLAQDREVIAVFTNMDEE